MLVTPPVRLLVLGGAAVLLWSAIVNGFPFLYTDSGAYIYSSHWLEVPPDRPVGYGLFIRATRLYGSLWLVTLTQALVTSFLLVRAGLVVLRQETRCSRRLVFGSLLVTAATSSVSQFVGYVMPDVFAAWLFLGGFLYLLDPTRLGRLAGALGILLALVVHNSHPLLAVASSLLALLAIVAARRGVPAPLLSRSRNLFGLVLVLAPSGGVLNGAFGAEPIPFRGAPTFLVNRLVESGVIRPILESYCLTKQWNMCKYKTLIEERIGHPEWYLWSDERPEELRDFQQLGGENLDVVLHGLACCKVDILRSSIEGIWIQYWHTTASRDVYKIRETHAAYTAVARAYGAELEAFRQSRQQRGLEAINTIPAELEGSSQVFWLAVATLLVVAAGSSRMYTLGAVVLAPLAFSVVNAIIIGSVGSLTDRLQARVIWLVPFFTCLAAALYAQELVRRARTRRLDLVARS